MSTSRVSESSSLTAVADPRRPNARYRGGIELKLVPRNLTTLFCASRKLRREITTKGRYRLFSLLHAELRSGKRWTPRARRMRTKRPKVKLYSPMLVSLDLCCSSGFEMNRKHVKYHCNGPGPSCLMARSDSCSIVAVKILIKQDQIFPMRIRLKLGCASVHPSLSFLVAEKDIR